MKSKYVILTIVTLGILYFLFGRKPLHLNEENSDQSTNNITVTGSSPEFELDEIYSLVAYAIVYKFWQDDDRNGRGYNVGSILVDNKKRLVSHALNSVNQRNNGTQHGEVQLLSNFLDSTEYYSLKDFTVYTTLEPCAMCAGMMTMVSIDRTVNGQNDRFFSKALERLAIDTESCGGYKPYPRIVKSQTTPSFISSELDKSYQEYINEGNKPIITKYLSSLGAKRIFREAERELLQFEVKHSQNKAYYKDALLYYHRL